MLLRQKNKHLLPSEKVLVKVKIADTLVLSEKIPFSGHEKEDNILCESNKPYPPLEKILLCINCSAKLRFTFTVNAKKKGRCPRCNAKITAEAKAIPWKARDYRKHYAHMDELLANGGKRANEFIREGGSLYAEKYGVSHVEIDHQDIGPDHHGTPDAEFSGVFTINNEHKIRATIIFGEFTVDTDKFQWITPVPENDKKKHQIECAIAGFVGFGICYKATNPQTTKEASQKQHNPQKSEFQCT